MDLSRLTKDQILEELEKCEEIADALQEEIITKARGIPLQETEHCHLTTEAILVKTEDCHQARITLHEAIISRAKERVGLAARLEHIQILSKSRSSEKSEHSFKHFH